MRITETDGLMQANEVPCISIIVPTDRVNKKKNYEVLKKSLQKAKALLKNKELSEEIRNNLLMKIEGIIPRLPESVSAGIGIYISRSYSTIITLPFDVKSKVIIGNSFDIRDLLYLKQYSSPYYILKLSKRGVHLYEGSLDEIREIKDGKFPLVFVDQFEYERASIADSSNSLKGFERDKTQISEIRLRSVFREADAHVKVYLKSDSKLLLAGTQKMIALYNSVASLKDKVAGKISGSYNENNLDILRDSAWVAIVQIIKKEIAQQIVNVGEKKNGQLAEGLQQAWTAASEGKGRILMIEKDLHHRGYRKDTDRKFYLQPPKKPYVVIPDIVEDLIETVRAKHGEVLLTEEGQLKAFDHVALVLRY